MFIFSSIEKLSSIARKFSLNVASDRELKFVAERSPVEGLKYSLVVETYAVWFDPAAATNTG